MRYAIYFTPPEGHPLALESALWLGREAFHDKTIRQKSVDGFGAEEIVHLTEEPRRYGFHATLKAPFEISLSHTEDDLIETFEAFAASVASFEITITLGQLGPFFAFVPSARSDDLHALADACVTHFEPFRAALSAADIARRRPERLSESERHNLDQWGYPHVFSDFKFHMTLTGQVPADRQEPMRKALAGVFASFIDKPLAVSHLALFIEPERAAPFVMKRIAPLLSPLQRKTA